MLWNDGLPVAYCLSFQFLNLHWCSTAIWMCYSVLLSISHCIWWLIHWFESVPGTKRPKIHWVKVIIMCWLHLWPTLLKSNETHWERDFVWTPNHRVQQSTGQLFYIQMAFVQQAPNGLGLSCQQGLWATWPFPITCYTCRTAISQSENSPN